MKKTAIALTCHLFAFSASVLIAADDTPAEQYAALLKEYGPVSSGMRRAENDLQRKETVESMGAFAPRFLDLAEKFSEDPIALDALKQAVQVVATTDSAAQIAWETNRADFPAGISSESAVRTVRLLLRDHLLSENLGPVCDRMRYGYWMEYAGFLRTSLRENPYHDVQGIACISLAQFLNDRRQMLQLTEDRPELIRRYETLFGKDYLPEIRRSAGAERIEALFERAAGEYADVKLVFGGTVGAKAETELYDLRHLSVGMAAPDIEGVDQDGEHFKLSDYRGKVVMLYFWSEY